MTGLPTRHCRGCSPSSTRHFQCVQKPLFSSLLPSSSPEVGELGVPLGQECPPCLMQVRGQPWSEGIECRDRGLVRRAGDPGRRESGGRRAVRGHRAVRRAASPPPPSPPTLPTSALTDEEDGEGDEEQEDVGHHVERVHEAAVVEDALIHPVGGRVVLAAAEGQGHGGAGRARARLRLAPRASAPLPWLLGCPALPSGSRPPHPRAPPRRLSSSPQSPPAPLPAGPGVVAAGSPTGTATLGRRSSCGGTRAQVCWGRRVSAPLRACCWKAGQVGGQAQVWVGEGRGVEERRRVRVGLE